VNSDFELTANPMRAAPGALYRYSSCSRFTAEEYLDLENSTNLGFRVLSTRFRISPTNHR